MFINIYDKLFFVRTVDVVILPYGPLHPVNPDAALPIF